MATRKYHQHHDQTPKFLYLGGGGGGDDQIIDPLASAHGFEMNETDLWNIGFDDHSNEPQNTIPRRSKFPMKGHQHRKLPVSIAAKSMPVNVPDWSMILRDEYKHHGRRNNDHDDDYDYDYDYDYDGDGDVGFDGDNKIMLPPHEYLARTRIASFSVHEGVGRTLKGRDLRRVRNAIWKQTGFDQD